MSRGYAGIFRAEDGSLTFKISLRQIELRWLIFELLGVEEAWSLVRQDPLAIWCELLGHHPN